MAARRWYANPYVLLIIIVSLVAMATASLTLLLFPQPSEILLLMQRKMAATPGFAVEADVQYRGSVTSRDAAGVSHSSDERVSYSTTAQAARGATAADARLHQQFSLTANAAPFAGEHVRIGNADFFRFTTLPSRLGSLHLDPLRDHWVRADFTRLASLTALPLIGGGRELQDDDRAALAERLVRTPFFQIEDKLKDETVGGAPAHHYKVRLEMLYVKDFYLQSEARRLGRELTNQERLAADAFFANLSAEDGELWIGSRDYLLRRAHIRFTYDDGKRSGTIDVAATFSDFGAPGAIAAPPAAEVQDVTPLLTSLLPGIAAHLPLAKDGEKPIIAPNAGADATAGGLPVDASASADDDADHDGLPGSLELFYGADPNNPDSDGDGVNDGAEVAKGDSPTGPGPLFDFTDGRFR